MKALLIIFCLIFIKIRCDAGVVPVEYYAHSDFWLINQPGQSEHIRESFPALSDNTVIHSASRTWTSNYNPPDIVTAEGFAGFRTIRSGFELYQFSSAIFTSADPNTFSTAYLYFRFFVTDADTPYTISSLYPAPFSIDFQLRYVDGGNTQLFRHGGSVFADGAVLSGILSPGLYEFQFSAGSDGLSPDHSSDLRQLDFTFDDTVPPTMPICPEPATLLLTAAGTLLFMFRRNRNGRNA